MKILIVAATEEEIAKIRAIRQEEHQLRFIVTGPGMVATTYELSNHLKDNNYDLAINCGLAGSFDRSINIGEVVYVNEDILSELGAEDGDQFLTLKNLGLRGRDTFYCSDETAHIHLDQLKPIRSITVNTVHGNEKSIESVKQRLNPQTETMEGAAFYYVCEKEHIPAIQIRAVSNYVEKRNKEAWNIPLALENLKIATENLLSNIHSIA